jgi:hypothetical protein
MFGGVTGWGTDEDKIYDNLTGLTPVQGRAVRAMYSQEHKRDLDADLASELDEDNALIRARAALEGDPVMETVGALNEAISGAGTDEETIMRMLRGKTAEQRERIVEEYRRQYGVELQAELDSEMDDHDQVRAEALLAGDTARADAVALDQAMHGGVLGWGTDEAQIESVYGDIRNDVAGQQVPDGRGGMRPMTQDEMEAEVVRRNLQVEATYNAEYGSPGDQESALRAAYRSELSGPELDLANALADNDLIAADAARLERERRGFYTDDDVVNGILENQYGRALEGLRRDPEWRARRDAIQEDARRNNWDPYQIAAAERALDREMEQAARTGGAANMAALEARYDSNYSTWARGGLQTLIAFNMSGSDADKARALVEQGGYLSRAQRIDFATRGPGTDEAEFERATAGTTAAEIEEINAELDKMGRPTVQQIAESELSGREAQDMDIRLQGVPENAEQEMHQARQRTEWELRNSPVGGHEREVLQNRMARMERQYALINDPEADPFERRRALAQFQARGVGVQAGVEAYRNQIDAVTDAVATAAALTAAITVTVLTGGIAGAVLGALAAAAMTMSIKSVLKGAAYGVEEMAIDAVIGVVDAAAAAATFGVGNALLRVVTSQGGRVARLGSTRLAASLSRMAASGSRAQRMLAHGVGEAVEGAAGALPSALAGNMLRDENWEHGNPLLNIVGGTLVETGMGALVGGTLGSLGGVRAPRIEPPVPRTGDILAQRGTPQDRLDAWRSHKAANPDADMRTFLRQYDGQVADRLAAEAADATVQRALRTELLAGVPPRQRGQFADVPIEIMSDADFKAFTRSDSANAVTLVEGGEPRIILRDGAPPGVLREEGVHLTQLADRDLGPLVRRLDETRMRDWDSLPLGEKLDLYAVKLELEIDAQVKLIDGFEADIRRDGPDVDLDALRRSKAVAEDSLGTLRHRAEEVADLGLMDRIAMSRGLRDPPPYLDQPARLFNKVRAEAPKVRGDPGPRRDLNGSKTSAERSPLHGSDDFKPGDRIVQVGDPWIETRTHFLEEGTRVKYDDNGTVRILQVSNGKLIHLDGRPATLPPKAKLMVGTREVTFVSGRRVEFDVLYREVEHLAPDDTVKALRQETMKLNLADLSDRGWVQRGSESVAKGSVAELASGRVSHERLQRGEIEGYIRSQNVTGSGFDGAEVHIGRDGQPVITVIEVKNYPGRWVPFEDFTAVTENFEKNLVALRQRFQLDQRLVSLGRIDEAIQKKAAELGIDPRVVQLVNEALAAGRIDLEIRAAPGTKIGQQGSDAAMNRLRREWRNFAKPPVRIDGSARITDIKRPHMEEAEAAAAAVRLSQGANAARAIREPLSILGAPARYIDAAGFPLDVRRVSPAEAQGRGLDRLLDEIQQRLTNRLVLPNGFHADLTLALDLTDLTSAQRDLILREVQGRLKQTGGGRQGLKRLFPVLNRK